MNEKTTKEEERVKKIEQILRDMQNCVQQLNAKKEQKENGATKV